MRHRIRPEGCPGADERGSSLHGCSHAVGGVPGGSGSVPTVPGTEFLRTRSGFTLIELLVVASVLMILFSMLMPTFSGIYLQANQAHCASNQRQVAMALQLYMQDYNNLFPYCWGFNGEGPDWRVQLHPYLATYQRKEGYYVVFECPEKWYDAVSSYPGWDGSERGWWGGTGINIVLYPYRKPFSIGQVRSLSKTYFTMDTLDHHHFTCAPAAYVNDPQWLGFHHGQGTYTTMSSYGEVRRGGKAVVAYLDGHVGTVREEDCDADFFGLH